MKNPTRSLIEYVMPVVRKYGTHLISIPSSPQADNSAVMKVDDHSGRFKRLLPTTISSPDRSPQARKGQKATGQKSSAKKIIKF